MKLIILSVGLFCLLFFNYEGITTTQNYQSDSDAANKYCFEAGLSESFGGSEHNFPCIIISSEPQISIQEKLNSETATKLSDKNKKDYPIAYYKSFAFSKINLFLIFNHSLALYQVFLQ